MDTMHKLPCRFQMVLKSLIAVGASLLVGVSAAAQDTPPGTRPSPRPSTQPAATKPDTAPPKDLPPAKEIIDASIKAMGGKEAFEAIESTSIKATMTGSPMGDVNMTMVSAKPGRFLVTQSMPAMGETSIGCDGTVGWMNSPMMGGYQLLDEQQTKEMQQQSNMFRLVLKMEEDYPDHETVDKTEFNGQDCYKIKLVNPEGKEGFAFFSVDKKLIQGMEVKEETPMGAVNVSITFDQWKEIGDVKVFTKMNIEQMGMAMAMTFNEVDFNKADPAAFELPEEVKELVKKRDAPPETQPETQPATQPATRPANGPGQP